MELTQVKKQRAKKPGDTVESGKYLTQGREFHYQLTQNRADYSLPLTVKVSELMNSGQLRFIGDQFVQWHWSGRWGARQMIREQLRRFG